MADVSTGGLSGLEGKANSNSTEILRTLVRWSACLSTHRDFCRSCIVPNQRRLQTAPTGARFDSPGRLALGGRSPSYRKPHRGEIPRWNSAVPRLEFRNL